MGTEAMNCNTELTKQTLRSKPKPELFNLKLGMMIRNLKNNQIMNTIYLNKAIRSQHRIINLTEGKLDTNNNKTKNL